MLPRRAHYICCQNILNYFKLLLKFLLGSEAWGKKQKKCIGQCWASRWFLLFCSTKCRSQVWILIYWNWSIGFFWAKRQFCTCITALFSIHVFPWRPLHSYNVELPFATFSGGREHTKTNFPFNYLVGYSPQEFKSPMRVKCVHCLRYYK